ncbi:MAG: substrate-binding domain-containing protein [Acidimicrobiia bacterium]
MSRWLAAGLILAASACGAGSERVIVAAGTTLVDSGLMDAVVAEYEALHPGVEVSVVAEPTALALELGRRGAVDLLIVHASEQEAIFVEQGHGFASRSLVESRFVLVGPPDGIAPSGLPVTEAFHAIASAGRTFVSRGDLSGTHDRELSLWAVLEVDPGPQEWYIESGQGMGQTLLIADQRSGFTLAELGAFLEARDALSLVDYQVTGEELANPYTAYVATSASNRDGAVELLEWLGSPEGTAVIESVNIRLFGEVVYRPVTE